MVRAETLPEEKREAIVHALGKLKQRVLWKWENDTLPNQPSNVFIRKWMPQRDILCKFLDFCRLTFNSPFQKTFKGHPNVRVFITHGGLLGSSEAAYCGVPVISTPFYGDQFLNAAAMEKRGMAVILKYQDINKDSVFQALRKALDPKMLANAKKVSYSYVHRPMTPKEAAVYWSEYVIATGGASLTRPHTADAHWFIYAGLDIHLFVIIVFCLTVVSWIYLWRKMFAKSIGEQKKTRNSRAASLEQKMK